MQLPSSRVGLALVAAPVLLAATSHADPNGHGSELAQDAAAAAAPTELGIAPMARTADSRPTFRPGELIVKHHVQAEEIAIRGFEVEMGLTRLRQNDAIGAVLYALPEWWTVADALRALRDDPRLDYAEPNFLSYLHNVPNDGFYDNYSGVATDLQKWVYDGIGGDRNLNAEGAWDVTTGNSNVVIAVIDTGCELNHPDLAPNIWTNPGEIAGNGQDDDGNGFVDDVNGWDFYSNDNNPNPDYGDGFDNDFNGAADDGTFHGTFSASCAAAAGNDGTGMAGAAWNCKIMPIKIFTDDGGASTFDIADGITYAANNGADVANMSFGGGFSSTVQSAVNYSWGQGVVQVASAGNSNSSGSQYPASLNHVISVGAGDSGSVFGGGSGDIDGRAFFSQYGTGAVDVVAPGHQLVGASVGTVAGGDPGQDFWILSSGTSFSGPIVAGLAGLLVSRSDDLGAGLSNDDIEAIIQDTAVNMPDDPNDSPNGGSNWDNHGRVDFLAAINSVTGGGGPTNNPPVANAGANQSGTTGIAVAFDGTGSFDPDGDTLTSYTWNFGDGSNGTGATTSHTYSSAGSYTVTLTVSDGEFTDSDTASVTIANPPTGGPELWMASRGNNSVSGIGTVRNEDILAWDPATGGLSFMFDGSDVGLSNGAIDALHVLGDGDLILSFTASRSVPGIVGAPGGGTTVDDSDLVIFTPSSLGSNTSGVFTFLMDGSDIGLTANGEDIDGVCEDSNGDLLLSTVGSASINGLSGIRDEDVFRFVWTTLGSSTAGNSVMHLDGSDVGLSTSSSEDVDAIHQDGNVAYISTLGTFSVSGLSGDDEDLFTFTGSFGSSTSGSFAGFFDGSAEGMPSGWDIHGASFVE